MNLSVPSIDLRLHNGRLLLAPEDPMAAAPTASLAELLGDGQLISSTSLISATRFSPGKRLFEYIGFTGCAVQLDQGPIGAAGFEIELEGPFACPVSRLGRNSRPPRCPGCRRPLADWRAQLDQTERDDSPTLHCADCGAEEPAWRWNWGRQGGFGRLLINLEPVFPGEGRPLPALFRLLEHLEIGPWRYFYVQD